MINKLSKSIISLLVVFCALGVQANSTRTNVKNSNSLGTYLGLGNPMPSLIGLNLAYNLNPNWRGVIGYGEVEVTTSLSWNGNSFVSETTKATTYATGVDYLFTDWTFRPILGARLGYFKIEGDGEFSVQGFDESTFLAYGSAGFDYLSQSGFYFGTGMNLVAVGGSGSSFYANLGYFF